MMLTTLWSLTLLCSAPAAGGEDLNTAKVVPTTLTAIRQTPESFKGVWVRFDAQFSAVGRLQNPFFTRFVASDFANFHVWADEQPIWQESQYNDVFALMFMNKENESLSDMVRLGRFQRIQVTAVVRNTFQDMPWIEVMGFTPLEGRVDSATLSHMFRGEQHMLRRDWTKAVSELSLAPAEGVPTTVRSAVHRNLGICHLRMGEISNALTHLQAAAELGGENRELKMLLNVAQSNPTAGIDHDVDRESVKETDRPLWEAFAPLREPSAPPAPISGN